MSSFLAGLGAALTAGSELSARSRQQKLKEEQAKWDREQQLLQMALSRENADLQQEQLGLQRQQFEFNTARQGLDDIGPNGVVDDALAARAEAAGLGGRVSAPATQIIQDPVSPSPIVMDGLPPVRTRVPTVAEQAEIDKARLAQANAERLSAEQARAREAVALPGFYKMPELNRAVVWNLAGFDGQPPQSLDEWQTRQRFQADLQQRNMLALEDARHTGDVQEALIRASASAGANKPATGLQQKAVGFFNRMKQAADEMAEVEDKVSPRELALINDFTMLPMLIRGNLLSPEAQRYAQAAQVWAEARLRDESGAAISLGEFDNDRRMGIRQAYDTPETLAQKRRTRDTMLDAIAGKAGRAYDDFYGEAYQRRMPPGFVGADAPRAVPPPSRGNNSDPAGLGPFLLRK